MLKQKVAMLIRVISVPPLMVAYLLALLYFFRDGVFANTGEFIASGCGGCSLFTKGRQTHAEKDRLCF